MSQMFDGFKVGQIVVGESETLKHPAFVKPFDGEDGVIG